MASEQGIPMSRALISVSDKTGLVDFVSNLALNDIQIVSTGGTADHLSKAGLRVTSVSQITGFPEIMNGRVKTLHPRIHGGILADREKDSHMQALIEHDIPQIDMVVVNLYPFARTIRREGVTLKEAIEQIDIGGPAMIRAAAKNHSGVAVVTDPADYQVIADELAINNGRISRETLARLAQKAFAHTAEYDGMISEYLGGGRNSRPRNVHVSLSKVADLRYGENPHQEAAYYRDLSAPADALVNAEQLHGKELSYNNIIDLQSAWKLACEWSGPACAIIKHNNPCGAAIAATPAEAYRKALASDPVSAFGSVIGFSVPVDAETATALGDLFVEAVIAPAYADDALELLRAKKNIRIMLLPRAGITGAEGSEAGGAAAPAGGTPQGAAAPTELRMIEGGALLQSADQVVDDRSTMQVVSERQPSDSEWSDLIFAWKVAAHVKSNAIVLAKDGATVGVGAGQMSRVDSSYLAVRKAGREVAGSVVASDAFFPFADALQVVVEAGATACIHPGGSIRDDEVTAYAKTAGIAMIHTGRRHFRH